MAVVNVAADIVERERRRGRAVPRHVNVPPVASTVIVWTSAVETIGLVMPATYTVSHMAHMVDVRHRQRAARTLEQRHVHPGAGANCTPVVTADAMASDCDGEKFWAYTVPCRPPPTTA